MKPVQKILVSVVTFTLFISACSGGGPKKIDSKSTAEMTLEALSFQLTVDGAIEQTVQADGNINNDDAVETSEDTPVPHKPACSRRTDCDNSTIDCDSHHCASSNGYAYIEHTDD